MPESAARNLLTESTSAALVVPDLDGADARGVLGRLAAAFAQALPGVSGAALARGLEEREALGSTALGGGLAVPHCRVEGIDRPWLAIGIRRDGIDFGAADGRPVRVFLAVISPAAAPASHLQLLAAISRWARTPGRVDALAAAAEPREILSQLEASGGPR